MLQKKQTNRIDIDEIDRVLNKRCSLTKPLFFSYCHQNKNIVNKIADELEKLNYKIWIDRDLVAGLTLFPEIEKGIIESHMIICFISKAYCQSEICRKEIGYAQKKSIKILPIMLERVDKDCSNGVDFIISDILTFYAFKKPDMFDPWSMDHFNRLCETIHVTLSNICKICSKSVIVNTIEKAKTTDKLTGNIIK
jgi:hypothetical protein